MPSNKFFFNILHFFSPRCSCFSWLFLMLPGWPITHSVKLSQRSLCSGLPTGGWGATGKKPAFMHEEGIGDPTVWIFEKWSQTLRRQQAHQNKTSGKLWKGYFSNSFRHKTNMPKDKSLDAQQRCFLVSKTYLWEPRHYSSVSSWDTSGSFVPFNDSLLKWLI